MLKQWAAETTQQVRSHSGAGPQSSLTPCRDGNGVSPHGPQRSGPPSNRQVGSGAVSKEGQEEGLMGAAQAQDGIGVKLGEKETEMDRNGDGKRDAERHREQVSDEEHREGPRVCWEGVCTPENLGLGPVETPPGPPAPLPTETSEGSQSGGCVAALGQGLHGWHLGVSRGGSVWGP